MPYALPPAESKLSMRTITAAYFPARSSFEAVLNDYLGTEGCVLADSARSLLYMLFCHLQSKAGRNKTQVLIPGYTCYSVPAAAVKAGLRVALYDMDPATFQPDMDDAARKINDKTLAVVGQHLLGLRSDVSGLRRLSRQSGAYCIVDSAQLLDASHGVLKQDEADFTLFSFGRGKPLPLGGGGALIASHHAEALGAMSGAMKAYPPSRGGRLLPFALRFFSEPRVYWFLEKLPLGLGRTIYDPSFVVSDMSKTFHRMGAMGVQEMESLNCHRAAIGWVYGTYFQGEKKPSQKNMPIYLRYPLLVQNAKHVSLLARFGVRRLYPHALCDLPPLQDKLVYKGSQNPGAREIARRMITLPTHRTVNHLLADKIAEAVEKVFPKPIEVPRP